MHHHRLVLNGPPEQVDPLARALLAAGAESHPGADPPRLTWTTPSPPPLPALCADHPRAVVGIERFALLGESLERLVLRGTDATVLERRPFAPVCDEAPLLDDDALAECEPLDPALLRAAAARVADEPLFRGPPPTAGVVDDALLVGSVFGHACASALTSMFDDTVVAPPSVLQGLAALAAAALTAAANVTDAAMPGELAYERAQQLTEAHAVAGAERLWSRPGDADWPEWLMYIMLGAVAVVEDCAVALHEPPPPVLSLHAEHGATREERLGHATTRLVATCLQALALFAPLDCARN